MNVLLDEVVRLVAAICLWLVVASAIAAASGGALWWLVDRSPPAGRTVLWIVSGGLVTAALAHRLGIAGPVPGILSRPLPVVWVIAGALGTGAGLLAARRRVSEGG